MGIMYCRVLKFVWLLVRNVIQLGILTCEIETITFYKHTFRFCVKNWNAQLQNAGEVAVL